MKHAGRNSIILLCVGIFLLLLALVEHIPEIFICAIISICTSAVIDSLVSIFSKEENEDS